MRVIAGTAKGRTLVGPKSDRIRPALDKVKGAIFNILGNIEGCAVLDLFAGTGAIGIEALSRGARHCTFIDSGREAIQLIKKNIEICNFQEKSFVLLAELRGVARVRHPLARIPSPFDLIFTDPPYDKDLVNPTLKEIAQEKLLAPNGIVIVEHSPREKIEENTGLTMTDQRKYGQTLISFLK